MYGLAEEGLSRVGLDVCRITAVFFVPSSFRMRKHKAVHETVVRQSSLYWTSCGTGLVFFFFYMDPLHLLQNSFISLPLSKSQPSSPTISLGPKGPRHLKVIGDCAHRRTIQRQYVRWIHVSLVTAMLLFWAVSELYCWATWIWAIKNIWK